MAATLELGLESVDEKVDTTIMVKASSKVCAGMKPTDWVAMKHQFNHLRDTPFPNLAQKGVIHDLLASFYLKNRTIVERNSMCQHWILIHIPCSK